VTNFEIVQTFYRTWASGNLDGCLEYCTDDLVWDNVPIRPLEGKQRVREFLGKFASGMSNARYEIKNHLEFGDLLMLEGIEMYEKSDRPIAVPYMAIFRFRDGRIAEMRDYFDLATVERQLGLKD
jgi:limonene-1,2-epoxide hydrolase